MKNIKKIIFCVFSVLTLFSLNTGLIAQENNDTEMLTERFSSPSYQNDIFFPQNSGHSILYRYKILDQEAVKAARENAIKEENIQNQKDNIAEKEPIEPIMINNLLLDSIVYNSPKSWSVWVNKEKVTNFDDNNRGEFVISSVKENYADIVILNNSLKYFLGYLDSNLKKAEEWSDWDYLNEEQNVFVNVDEGIILARIQIGQAFESRSLSIKESFYELAQPTPIQPTIKFKNPDIFTGNVTVETNEKEEENNQVDPNLQINIPQPVKPIRRR